MAQQTIITGNSASDGNGDPLRTAFTKINENFTELYSGNVQITAANVLVYSVAGRTGNIALSTSDVAGAASVGYVNSAIATNIANYSGSVINTINANVSAANATISDHSSRINVLESNTASQALQINSLVSVKANVSYVDTQIANAVSNSIVAANMASINANITAANLAITALQANAAIQENEIYDLRANVTAANVKIDSLVSNAATQGASLVSLTANAVSQQNFIISLQGNDSTLFNSVSSLTANSETQESEIISLRANITAANVNIVNLLSNASTQESEIISLGANIIAANAKITTLLSNATIQDSAISWLNSNITAANVAISALQSNAAIQEISLTSLLTNAATQATQLNSINANVGAYQTWSNANAATQATTFTSINNSLNFVNNSIQSTNVNVAAVTANVASLLVVANIGNVTFADVYSSMAATNANVTAANSAILTKANLTGAVFSGNIQAPYVLANANVKVKGIMEVGSEDSPTDFPFLGSKFIGNVAGYYQIVVQNLDSSDNASSEMVFTADDGTDTSNYLTIGINSSTYNLPFADTGFFEFPHDGFLESVGGNLSLRSTSNVSLAANTSLVALQQDGDFVLFNCNLQFADSSVMRTANIGAQPFTTNNASNWNGAVTTIQDALDQLAARLAALGG
jgi:adhesin/invasin